MTRKQLVLAFWKLFALALLIGVVFAMSFGLYYLDKISLTWAWILFVTLFIGGLYMELDENPNGFIAKVLKHPFSYYKNKS